MNPRPANLARPLTGIPRNFFSSPPPACRRRPVSARRIPAKRKVQVPLPAVPRDCRTHRRWCAPRPSRGSRPGPRARPPPPLARCPAAGPRGGPPARPRGGETRAAGGGRTAGRGRRRWPVGDRTAGLGGRSRWGSASTACRALPQGLQRAELPRPRVAALRRPGLLPRWRPAPGRRSKGLLLLLARGLTGGGGTRTAGRRPRPSTRSCCCSRRTASRRGPSWTSTRWRGPWTVRPARWASERAAGAAGAVPPPVPACHRC